MFIGPLFFFPFKVFFQTSEKDGCRRLRGEAVDVLRIQDDRHGVTRDKKSRIPRGELSPNLNGRSRHENRRLISAALCEASAAKRDRQTRFSPGWFLFITKTDDSWGLARNPGEMARALGGRDRKREEEYAISCRLGYPARLLGEAIHSD